MSAEAEKKHNAEGGHEGGHGHGNGQPIIKKNKKHHGHGHHGGAWKVAYADFVTAMMALFIVLWVMGQSADVKEKVAEYFNDPSVFALGKGRSVIKGRQSSTPNIEINETDMMKKAEEKAQMEKMGQEIYEQLKGDVTLQGILDQIKIEFVDEGMKIELLESQKEAFFEIGTARLNERAFNIIKMIGQKISKLHNLIVIEGHTDSRPYQNSGIGYTNYELSSDRANSARRALILGGVTENQVEGIRGFADKRLRNLKDPYDVINRRVDILVKYSN